MKISMKHFFSFVMVLLFAVVLMACEPSETEKFTVEFNPVGGTPVESVEVEKGGLVPEPTPPTREDYTFGGWYKEFALENPWNFETDTVESNITLYAKWNPVVPDVYYTVTFVGNGGMAPDPVEVIAGGSLPTVSDPIRGGYTFVGWYKDADLTQAWNSATDKVNANITLYAKWEPIAISFTVVFETNGGSAIPNQTVAMGAKATQPANPTKPGYVFVGWYANSALTTPYDFNSVVNSHKTIYAKWAEEVEVTFDAGDGDVLPGSVKVAKGSKVNQPDALYAGYELVGWFKDAAFTQPWNFDIDVVETDITLYAQWWQTPEGTAIFSQDDFYNLLSGETTYEVGAKFYLRNDLDFQDFVWDPTPFTETLQPHTFILNGNGKTISNISFAGTAQAGLIQRMASGSIYDLTLENIHLEGQTQGGILIGRVFNGSTVDIHDVTIINSSVSAGKAGTSGVGTLIGHIQGQNGKSTVNVSNVALLNVHVESAVNSAGGLVGDVESSKLTVTDAIIDVTVVTTGERVGGIVGEARRASSNQNDLPELVIENVLVRANLTGIRYLGGIVGRADNNMLNLDAEIHGSTSKTLPGSFKDIVMILNYDTTHASDNNNGHIARSNVPTPENVYVVAFNYDRATLGGINVPNENVLDDISDLTAAMFAGFGNAWSDIVDGQLPKLNGMALDPGHKVTLHINDEVTKVQYVKDGAKLSPIYVAAQEGLPFDKFFMDETFETPYLNEPIEENLDLYAHYSQVFQVSFETNGGSAVATVNVLDGATVTLPNPPTKFGSTFGGWFTDSELTLAFDPETPITENMTLYAKWVDDQAPVITFMTEPGAHVLPGNGQLVVEFKVEDASALAAIELTFDEVTYQLAADEDGFKDEDEALAFALIGVLEYNAATKTFKVTLSVAKTQEIDGEEVTFEVKAKDALDNESAVVSLTVEVEIVIVEHTVSFETNGADAIEDMVVLHGLTIELPVPVRDGFVFGGWFTDSDLTEAFDDETPITLDLTLYAKWTEYVPEGTAISTPEELMQLFATGGSESYYLANDIDFTGIPLESSTSTFSGVLDGNGHTIRNITATSPTNKRGVFFKIFSGTIKNLKIENSHFTGGGEASGFITAHVNGNAVFENIEFFMVGVTNLTSSYTALLAGDDTGNNSSSVITMRNIIVRNFGDVKIRGNEHAGVLMGYMRVNDVTLNVENVYVESDVVQLGATAAYILGRINATVTINVTNAVLKGNLTATKQVGAIVGQSNASSTINMTKIFVSDSVFTSNESTINYFIGNDQGAVKNYNQAFVLGDTVELIRIIDSVPTPQVSTQGTIVPEETVDEAWFAGIGFNNDMFKVEDHRLVLNRESDIVVVDMILDMTDIEDFYLVGDTFNLESIKAKLLYNNGLTEDIPFEELEIDDETLDMNAMGEYEITVTHGEYSKVLIIKVVEIESIEIYETDFTDLYLVGESLDESKVYLFANLSNGTKTPINRENATIVTDFNGSVVGMYELSYTFAGFETQTLDVVVVEPYELGDEDLVEVYVDVLADDLETLDGQPLFNSIRKALIYLKKSNLNAVNKVMWIADGVYFEKLTIDIPNLTMVGESQENTIIDYNQAAGMMKPEGGGWGTQGSASVSVKGAATNFAMANLTVLNSFDYYNSPGINDKQGVALVSEADMAIYYRVSFYGVQDTLYAKQGRQWYLETYIEGAVDFIFGNTGPVFIEDSHIHVLYRSNADQVITAFKGFNGNNAADGVADYGVVFYNNVITSENEGGRTVFLGRPWAQEASVAYINNVFELDNLNADGWTEMSGNLPQNASFYEYGNKDALNNPLPNTTHGKTLTVEQAEAWADKDVVFATTNGGITWGATWDYEAHFERVYHLVMHTPVYVVSFETNSELEINPIKVYEGYLVTLPLDPTRLGYIFEGWFVDEELTNEFDPESPITEDMVLYAKWTEDETPLVYHTVSFEVDGGDDLEDEEVLDGASYVPPTPTKVGHVFQGWFLDSGLTEAFVNGTAVTTDLVLYAKWMEYVPEGTPITTTEEFLALISSGGSGNYYLANDLDFTGVEVVAKSATFTGVLDGNFKTISNINATATANKTGVFFKNLTGGTIKNLTIVDSNYTPAGTGEASGFLVGAIGGNVTFDNLTFLNVSINGYERTAGYNALLAGDNAVGASATDVYTFSNITVINDNDKKINSPKYAGGLLGYLRNAAATINITNIYFDAPVVAENSNESGNEAQAAGMLIGRLGAAAIINVTDVVVKGYVRASKNVGVVIGTGNAGATINITNLFASDLVINSGTSAAGLLYGNNTTLGNVTNVYYVTETVSLAGLGSLSQGTGVAQTLVDDAWLETTGFNTNLFKVVDGQVVRK